MFIISLLVIATFFVAWANGSNDNFKGVATLYGSQTVNYRTAVILATVATFLGSLCSIIIAHSLVKAFSGKGIVDIGGNPEFLTAVASGAAATVFLATKTGFPISTTHALIGGLCGAGLIASPSALQWSTLGSKFMLPLLISPILACISAAILYLIMRQLRQWLGITKDSCLCVNDARPSTEALGANKVIETQALQTPSVEIAPQAVCESYIGTLFGFKFEKLLDAAHCCSAFLVCFARGLNDTPKILGLLVALEAFNIDARWGLLVVAVAMAIGGLVHMRRVAETLSKKITDMNKGQGFIANFITGILVTCASSIGVPVSTTHVSVGSLFGIGAAGGGAHKAMIAQVLLSWILTLPIAAALAAIVFILL